MNQPASTTTPTPATAVPPFGPPRPPSLRDIAHQIGQARIWLDLGAHDTARAQLEHTQALVLDLAGITERTILLTGE